MGREALSEKNKIEYYINKIDNYAKVCHTEKIYKDDNDYFYKYNLDDITDKEDLKKLEIRLFLIYRSQFPTVGINNNGILSIPLGKENQYDVSITIPKDSAVIHISDKQCYQVIDSNDNPYLFVFYDNIVEAICVVNMNEKSGEILYPKINKSIQFKFIKKFDHTYRIIEFMKNNDKLNTIKIDSEKIYEAGMAIYYLPISESMFGVCISPYDNLLKVIEKYEDNEKFLKYTKEASLIL